MASIFLAALLGTLSGDLTHSDKADVMGHWYTPDRKSIIEVTDCGDGTPCGTIVWLADEKEEPLLDLYNKDEELRSRRLQGVTIFSGFEQSGARWLDGEIYNPENGATYRAKIWRKDSDELQVKGCVGPVCKGFVWHAADAPID